jgi:trk system potassium uptake protein TrkA
MYTVIVGAGKVGYGLYQDLKKEGHEVLIIENDTEKYEELEKNIGEEILNGDGCEVSVQTTAGVDRAEMFVAVTGEDEDNLAACQLAKERFAVPQVISRVNSPKNEHIFSKLGINCTVDVVSLILKNIKTQASICPLVSLANVNENHEIVLVKLEHATKAIGKSIKSLKLPSSVTASLLIRGQTGRIPSEDTILEAGDSLVIMVSKDDRSTLHAIFTA